MYFGISQSKTWILFQTLWDSVILYELDTQGLTAHICKRQTIMPILLYYFEDVIGKVPSVVLGIFNLCENFFSLTLFYSHKSNNFLVGLCCIFYVTNICHIYFLITTTTWKLYFLLFPATSMAHNIILMVSFKFLFFILFSLQIMIICLFILI